MKILRIDQISVTDKCESDSDTIQVLKALFCTIVHLIFRFVSNLLVTIYLSLLGFEKSDSDSGSDSGCYTPEIRSYLLISVKKLKD